ncbi:MAG: phage late control D family protein [Faecalibacterium sp.]
MGGFDASGSYSFASLEKKYSSFLSPTVRIEVGGFQLGSGAIPVTEVRVELTTENRAGSCQFTLDSLYDYETGKWSKGLLESIDVAQLVEVELGYAESQKRVFYGYVDRYRVEYTASGAPRLTVYALDGLGVLMADREKLDFGQKKTNDVVREILSRCQASGVAEKVSMDSLPVFEAPLLKEKGCSSYEFLCRMAEMSFMSFCIINGELMFKNLMKNTKTLLTLTIGQDLQEFSREVSFNSSTVGSVTVISCGSVDKKELRGVAHSPSRFGASGKTGAEKWAALGEASNKDIVINSLQTEQECEQIAQNILDGMSLGFSAGGGRCLGLPELCPGRYVEVKGLDKAANGSYFVTKVTHTFSESGYTTEFEVKGFRSK